MSNNSVKQIFELKEDTILNGNHELSIEKGRKDKYIKEAIINLLIAAGICVATFFIYQISYKRSYGNPMGVIGHAFIAVFLAVIAPLLYLIIMLTFNLVKGNRNRYLANLTILLINVVFIVIVLSNL
nr:hypothetical protein [Bacteroidales bacterium]